MEGHTFPAIVNSQSAGDFDFKMATTIVTNDMPSTSGCDFDSPSFLETMLPIEKATVAVTGANGFLGQHLIKLMHTHRSHISTIRVLDFHHFEMQMSDFTHTYEPAMDSVCGSVTSMDDCMALVKGATTVFHLASFTDRHLFADTNILNTVNVQGTRNIVQACIENGVNTLIYVSDVCVVIGKRSIIRGTETDTKYPKEHLFPDGPSKTIAEKLVLEANGSAHLFGNGQLTTISMRLVTLFGELDSSLFPDIINVATTNQGHIPCVGSLKTKVHFMYVGNAAWALMCAYATLNKDPYFQFNPNQNDELPDKSWKAPDIQNTLPKRFRPRADHMFYRKTGPNTLDLPPSLTNLHTPDKPKPPLKSALKSSCRKTSPTFSRSASELERLELEEEEDVVLGGKAYFICDDTAPTNFYEFIKPIIWRYGFFLTEWTLPEKWALLAMKIVYVILWLLYPFKQYNLRISISTVYYMCHNFTFSDRLFRNSFQYTPLFSKKESLQRTRVFYDSKYKATVTKAMTDAALHNRHVGILRQMHRIRRDISKLDLGDDGKRFRGKTKTMDNMMAHIKN